MLQCEAIELVLIQIRALNLLHLEFGSTAWHDSAHHSFSFAETLISYPSESMESAASDSVEIGVALKLARGGADDEFTLGELVHLQA